MRSLSKDLSASPSLSSHSLQAWFKQLRNLMNLHLSAQSEIFLDVVNCHVERHCLQLVDVTSNSYKNPDKTMILIV